MIFNNANKSSSVRKSGASVLLFATLLFVVVTCLMWRLAENDVMQAAPLWWIATVLLAGSAALAACLTCAKFSPASQAV